MEPKLGFVVHTTCFGELDRLVITKDGHFFKEDFKLNCQAVEDLMQIIPCSQPSHFKIYERINYRLLPPNQLASSLLNYLNIMPVGRLANQIFGSILIVDNMNVPMSQCDIACLKEACDDITKGHVPRPWIQLVESYSLPTVVETDLCVICLERPRVIAFLPCGHQCVCSICVDKLCRKSCPICNSVISDHIKMYQP